MMAGKIGKDKKSEEMVGLILFLILTGVFIVLAYYASSSKVSSWDISIMLAIHRFSHPWLDIVMLWITETGSVLGVLFLAILVVMFIRKGKIREAILFPSNFVLSVGVNSLLKEIIARPRPRLFYSLVIYHSDSFPSGHTIAAVSLYGLLAVYLWNRNKKILSIFSALWMVMVGLSRIYLGAHYPSDVLGAVALGGIFLIISWEIFKKRFEMKDYE